MNLYILQNNHIYTLKNKDGIINVEAYYLVLWNIGSLQTFGLFP